MSKKTIVDSPLRDARRMSRIPRPFINELLARCDIVEIIDARITLRKKGNNYSACCPFHNEKTPSFTVSSPKQFYHCFGCGVNGNAISFLMEHDRLTFVEAVEYLAAQLGMEIPREAGQVVPLKQPDLYQLMEKAAKFYQQQLPGQTKVIDYLKQRGLSGRSAKEFCIGYAPSAWDALLKHLGTSAEMTARLHTAGLIIKKTEGGYYDRFRDRIMFPIRDRRGRVIAFGGRVLANEEPKYLNSPETPIYHKGSELYGLYEACQVNRQIPRLVVVEGYIDVVALAQFGIRNAVATLGTATTTDHVRRLFRITPEVVFCFDGDRAGQAAAWRALETTLPLLQDGWQARFLFLPDGEDPDSLVRKEGAEQLLARFAGAQSSADFLFAALSKQIDLNSAEGKARLAKLALPHIHKLPAGVFQHMLFERLANLVRMDVNTLKNISHNPAALPEVATEKKPVPRRTAMRMVIALLLQQPNLVHSLAEPFERLILPGSELLMALVKLLKESTDLNTASLIEYWRDRPEYDLCKQLVVLETNVSTENVEQVFLNTFARLQQLNRETIVEQLLVRARQDLLTDAEKNALQKLIAVDKMQ